MTKLTQEQIDALRLVPNGTPVRFQENGQTCNISTGEKLPKGVNVMYQQVYWRFTRETALEIAKLTGTKAVFSE